VPVFQMPSMFSSKSARPNCRASFRREFEEGQRTFAVAAYRRICEIDMSASRLINRIRARTTHEDSVVLSELNTLLAVALGIRQTARSSIADWADVIGEEIAAMEQIEEIKDEHDATLTRHSVQDRKLAMLPLLSWPHWRVSWSCWQPSCRLRYVCWRASDPNEPHKGWRRANGWLEDRLKHDGFLELGGFWEPNEGFERGPEGIAAGDRLKVAIKDAGLRVACLMLCESPRRVCDGWKVSSEAILRVRSQFLNMP
jgi:hypothetical protein